MPVRAHAGWSSGAAATWAKQQRITESTILIKGSRSSRMEAVLEGVAEGSVVADIGAGGGWFTIRLARRVGGQPWVEQHQLHRAAQPDEARQQPACPGIEREAEYVADIRRRLAHVKGDDTPLFQEGAA